MHGAVVALAVAGILCCAGTTRAGETKGTLTHPKGTVALKYSYLVKGPDAVDTNKIIRRVVFSGSDLGAKLQSCAAMNCVDGAVTEGMIVDLDVGPRLNYWMAINGARVQYSGTLEPSALKATATDPKRLAGKLVFDDAGSGGPKVEVDFDDSLLKEFSKAR
jgi:hypothetical protein